MELESQAQETSPHTTLPEHITPVIHWALPMDLRVTVFLTPLARSGWGHRGPSSLPTQLVLSFLGRFFLKLPNILEVFWGCMASSKPFYFYIFPPWPWPSTGYLCSHLPPLLCWPGLQPYWCSPTAPTQPKSLFIPHCLCLNWLRCASCTCQSLFPHLAELCDL
jgi:hypothetical protein